MSSVLNSTPIEYCSARFRQRLSTLLIGLGARLAAELSCDRVGRGCRLGVSCGSGAVRPGMAGSGLAFGATGWGGGTVTTACCLLALSSSILARAIPVYIEPGNCAMNASNGGAVVEFMTAVQAA